MLDTLIKGFTNARQKLTGKAKLSEENIDEALSAVRISLLEADVDFYVTKNFIEKVKEKAVGEIVQVRVSHDGKKIKVSPGDHFIKICQEELEALMGPVDVGINIKDYGITSIMMVGLQGSGKTTTCGKIANYVREKGKKPFLVACDIYRPAAIEQLKVLGERLNLPVFYEEKLKPPKICKKSLDFAEKNNLDVAIFDTAGRLAIDDDLMNELEDIKKRTNPENIFLVCDAMIGQDAVKTAKEFERRLDLSGFILTKLDGDTRGGAALSIKEVTGKPIKFLGIGEGLDKLEEFRPEGLASRILGMGDIVGLVSDFEKVADEKQAEEDAMKMLKGSFTFDDFLSQIKMIKKLGPMQDVLEKMPGFSQMVPAGVQVDDEELVRIESIISSMTKAERQTPTLVTGSRVERIAKGCGREVNDVSALINKFFMMKKMMANLSKGAAGKIPGMKHLKSMGMDFSEMFPDQEKKPVLAPVKGLSKEDKRRLKNIKKRKKKDKKKNR